MKVFTLFSATVGMTVLLVLLYCFITRTKSPEYHLSEAQFSLSNQIQTLTQCFDKPLRYTIREYGKYWVFYNFVRAKQQFKCYESVTFTTVGDYLHIENLIWTVERWKGPISVALHAAGEDIYPTLRSIAYLRNCQSWRFKDFVSFHIVSDFDHIVILNSTNNNASLASMYKDVFNCSLNAPYTNITRTNLYKTKHNITLPINVLRNVARDSAQTHFVLAADIELYPSINIIPNFLNLIVNRKKLFKLGSKSVFVLPLFEVPHNEKPPEDKKTLLNMYNNKKAFIFHAQICMTCHLIPKFKEWMDLSISNKLDVFTSAKRKGKFRYWEPFYIGTNEDPFFEERVHWENGGDKMQQNYKQCLLDYDYWILDNAFLVHKPGIKTFSKSNPDTRKKWNKYSKDTLETEYKLLYGKRDGC